MHINRLSQLIIALGIVLCVLVGTAWFPEVVSAQDDFGLQSIADADINLSAGASDIRVTIVRIINFILGFLGIIAVLVVLYGGWMYMTSGGSEERVTTAKKILINGAIGLAIILSSFALTSFIINKLQEVIGGDIDPSGDSDLVGSCTEPGTPFYEKYINTTVCTGFCSLYPGQCCSSEYFVVKSITPHTPGDAVTGMDNAVIRAVFSKKVGGDPAQVIRIFSRVNNQNTDITDDFVFTFAEERYVVEARYSEGAACHVSTEGDTLLCVPEGEYVVEVRDDVVDTSGTALTVSTPCGDYPRVATFDTGENPVVDTQFGILDPVSIDGYAGDDIKTLVRGSTYTINTVSRDDTGNGYIRLRIFREGDTTDTLKEYVDGPRLSEGSSSDYVFDYGFRVDGGFQSGQVYVAHITALDIDSNIATSSVRFRVVPPSCVNGILDPGETAIDQGGVCGGGPGNTCGSDADCAEWLKCMNPELTACDGGANCSCTAVPYIADVQHMDGAEGNWITILGKNFGSVTGTVQFHYADDDIVPVTASLAQCRVGRMWTDSWIIAEVPPKVENANNPSISVTDSRGLTDFTNDHFGPNIGTFTYNTIQRPGLCAVVVTDDQQITLADGTVFSLSAGSTKAPPGTGVSILGKGFGTTPGVIAFGQYAGGQSSWSGDTILSAVPFGTVGRVAVSVTVGGETSNSVPFVISSLDDLYPPTIFAIDPPATTRGSYITISGTHFGSSGAVYFVTDGATVCPGGGCIPADTLPLVCGGGWSNTEIVAKVPNDNDFVVGVYGIKVVRDDDGHSVQSVGDHTVTVIEGTPRPSICRIDPPRGTAPLQSSATTIAIYGENFNTPQVRFWYPLADSMNTNTWMYSSLTNSSSGDLYSIVSSTATLIRTGIPYDIDSGLSMSGSAPIRVVNGNGLQSNSVNYDVNDCRLPGTSPISGFQCCSEGPDAGRWKNGSQVCEGGTREAGYVWRFTTGKIPETFRVVESCSEGVLPSPSPSSLWAQGASACLNAQLQVRFTLPIDESSVRDQNGDLQNINVYICDDVNGSINCTATSTDVTSDFVPAIWGNDALVLERRSPESPYLNPDTWYRVVLSDRIASLRTDTELGESVIKSETLEPTRTCSVPSSGAYCFDFRTGNSEFFCSLTGADLYPPQHTTSLLGIVQDSRFAPFYDVNRIFTLAPPLQPLHYFVSGRTNMACVSIGVDDKPWVWGGETPDIATATKYPTALGDRPVYENARGYATAFQNCPFGCTLFARVNEIVNFSVVDMLALRELATPYGMREAGNVHSFEDTVDLYNLSIGKQLHIQGSFDFHELDSSADFFYSEQRNILSKTSLSNTNQNGSFAISLVHRSIQAHDDLVITFWGDSSTSLVFPIQANDLSGNNLISSTTTFDLYITPLSDTQFSTTLSYSTPFAQSVDTKTATVSSINNQGAGYRYTLGGGVLFAHNYIMYGELDMVRVMPVVGDSASVDIVATSTLHIDLGNPYAKNVWPLCTEACVNAEIGIEFNQLMDMSSYSLAGINLYKCTHESCTTFSGGPLDLTLGFSTETILRVYPSSVLEQNTWYLVDVDESAAYAIGGVKFQGTDDQEIVQGAPVSPRQWKFKTKDSPQRCTADSVSVVPDPFVSTFIGQQQLYRAHPKGSPDSCNPRGQLLNPWEYGWQWSSRDPAIASVSDFSFLGLPKSTCTFGCTPAGSTISRSALTGVHNNLYPVCGDGRVDPGETCDIAIAGEIPGVSCTFACLRPGNTNTTNTVILDENDAPINQNLCGDGYVSFLDGEECDPNDPHGVPGFCTDNCLFTGSSQVATGDVSAPICGSGGVTYGEHCDINDPETSRGCTQQCLYEGTSIAQSWCDGWVRDSNDPVYQNIVQSQIDAVCGRAVSVCGNGIIEAGEECEVGVNGATQETCSDRCLVQNACGTLLEQCSAGDEGCLGDCTFAGSSVSYSTPSVCGDGSVGIGEYDGGGVSYLSCELPPASAGNPLGHNPVQVVTSVGGQAGTSGDPVDYLETEIVAEIVSTDPAVPSVLGEGDYRLQCGYTEYTNPNSLGEYNNCPENDGNILGAGSNSCCVERPVRIDQYPIPNAGMSMGTEAVCRNTFISATFDREIPYAHLINNIEIVQSYPQGYNCSDHGGSDVTSRMQGILDMHGTDDTLGFWRSLWQSIKRFFVRIFSSVAIATPPVNMSVPVDVTWCTGNIPFDMTALYDRSLAGEIISTTVSISPRRALAPNSFVAVLLNGGSTGIRDMLGVSIKSPFGHDLQDYWVFRTGDEVCKLKDVRVSPSAWLYTAPHTARDFVAHGISTHHNAQLVVSLPDQYAWEWSWHPQENQIFEIPNVSTDVNTISSRNVQGHVKGVVQAHITADIFPVNNQLGKRFTTNFDLDAFFCQRPWPATGVSVSASEEDGISADTLFKDSLYNFSMYYCADSGSAFTTLDDLPFFHTIEVFSGSTIPGVGSDVIIPDALRRYLMFADKTSDAIAIQVFANPPRFDHSRRTLDEWYVDKFGDLSQMTRSSVAGYPALRNQHSVYVNAFNVMNRTNEIYNNVYVFSIDVNASSETRQVFDQLVDSLTFNINLTNHGKCILADDPEDQVSGVYGVRFTPDNLHSQHSCSTDFDCRLADGRPIPETSGTCSVAKDKFFRDISRLEHTRSAQQKTDAYFGSFADTSHFELNLSSGTYIPGYTNSKWPSWGKLGGLIGGVPVDPINQHVGCEGHDPTTCWDVDTTTFKCPYYAQVYEYSYSLDVSDGDQSYRYHVPFEFVHAGDENFLSQYVNMNTLDFDRWCTPEAIMSPFGGQCGDGKVDIGEECDPPGRSKIVTGMCSPGTYAVATCNSDCRYEVSACVEQSECGNGIVEPGEECDLGSQNGQYGSICTDQCTFATSVAGAQYCGNNQLDQTSTGNWLEFCDTVGGVCSYTGPGGEVIQSNIHILMDYFNTQGRDDMPSKWSMALGALDNLHAQTAPFANISLSVYSRKSNFVTPTSCSQNLGINFIPQLQSFDSSMVQNNIGVRPMRNALEEIYMKRDSIFGTHVNAPKKLIVFTEGAPKNQSYIGLDCIGNTPNQTIDIIERLYQAGIATYIINFGDSSINNNIFNQFADAGGTHNTSSLDNFYSVVSQQSILSATESILACSEYHSLRAGSCSWSCQSYGGYCGDGIVQPQHGEECDEGVNNGTGSCDEWCRLVELSESEPVSSPASLAPRCGDGVVDHGEQCDLGAQNGVVCSPEYGASCTFCSNSCQIITVDSSQYCGDGVVGAVEACDFSGGFVYAAGVGGPMVCDDKGSYACVNTCRELQNNCVACATSTTVSEGGTTPYISVLNPMTGEGFSPYSHHEYVSLYRKNPPGSTGTILQSLGFRKLNRLGNDNSDYIDPFTPYYLFNDANYQPLLGHGIETNLLCNGEYVLFYNRALINKHLAGVSFDAPLPQGAQNLSAVELSNQGYGDIFGYPVAGEVDTINNEVVMSPPVRENEMRAVVRWKKKQGMSDVLFYGEMYHDSPDLTIASNTIAYQRANQINCEEVTLLSSNYYVPDNCTPPVPGIWMHEILRPPVTQTRMQAITINAETLPDIEGYDAKVFGFYVASPNGPINQFKDYELFVDIYTYRPNQIPHLSVYRPTHSFSMKDAVPSTNTNAKYWHVFNIKIDTVIEILTLETDGGRDNVYENRQRSFSLIPVGAHNIDSPLPESGYAGVIATSQCQVRQRMPNTTLCDL